MKTRIIFPAAGIFLSCLLLHSIVLSQIPEWAWAQSIGGNHIDIAYAVDVSPSGDVYMGGSFRSNPMIVGDTSLNNLGGSDALLLQFSENGDIEWLIRGGRNRI